MVSSCLLRCLSLVCCFGLLASWSVGAPAQVRLLSEHPAERPQRLDHEWPAVLTHTHNWRFPEGQKAGSEKICDADDKILLPDGLHVKFFGFHFYVLKIFHQLIILFKYADFFADWVRQLALCSCPHKMLQPGPAEPPRKHTSLLL